MDGQALRAGHVEPFGREGSAKAQLVRSRGRIKTSPSKLRKTRIRRFLIEMSDALAQHDYVVGSPCTWSRASFIGCTRLLSATFRGTGRVSYTIGSVTYRGRTRKLSRSTPSPIDPPMTRDIDGFPMSKGPFKAKANVREWEGPGSPLDVPTAVSVASKARWTPPYVPTFQPIGLSW